MFNSQYYTCEQIDQRLLQGYVDDFNEVNDTNYSKEDLLLKLFQAINWDQVFGKYEDNPEFVRLYTDSKNQLLWGIKTNGDIYYGIGIPSQVKDYVDQKVSSLKLEKVPDIVRFLDDLINNDKTLKELLEEKVDKEPGKSLIDEDFALGVSYIDNPEYLDVKTDLNHRLLEAILLDGTKFIPSGLKTTNITSLFLKLISGLELDQVLVSTKENPEYLEVKVDNFNKVLEAILLDGTKFIPIGILTRLLQVSSINLGNLVYSSTEDNPEYLEVKVDNRNRIINGIRRDGDCIYGGININELKRDLDVESLRVGYDVVTDDLYTIENTNSSISLEYDEDTGDIYQVKDSKILEDLYIDMSTGDVYVEYNF